MPEFHFTQDIGYLLIAYAVVLIGVTLWMFLSKQKVLIRNARNLISIAIRTAIVFALFYGVCWISGVAIWFIGAALLAVIIVGIVIDIPFSGVFGFAVLYVIQQFVLGFPARHEWVLSPQDCHTRPLLNVEPHQELVGKHAKTISPLRPIGEVRLDDKTLQATAYDGQLIDAKVEVTIVNVRAGTLIVRRAKRDEDN